MAAFAGAQGDEGEEGGAEEPIIQLEITFKVYTCILCFYAFMLLETFRIQTVVCRELE